MPDHYARPTRPSAQYLADVAWLKAFRDCGWSGLRAINAANQALNLPPVPLPARIARKSKN